MSQYTREAAAYLTHILPAYYAKPSMQRDANGLLMVIDLLKRAHVVRLPDRSHYESLLLQFSDLEGTKLEAPIVAYEYAVETDPGPEYDGLKIIHCPKRIALALDLLKKTDKEQRAIAVISVFQDQKGMWAVTSKSATLYLDLPETIPIVKSDRNAYGMALVDILPDASDYFCKEAGKKLATKMAINDLWEEVDTVLKAMVLSKTGKEVSV